MNTVDTIVTAWGNNPSGDPMQMEMTPVAYHLYDRELEDVMRYRVIITNSDIHDRIVCAIPIQMCPSIRLTIIEMVDYYKISQRDLIATLGKYGNSIFRHEYNLDLKKLKNRRTELFNNDFDAAVRKWGYTTQLYGRVKGGRKQVNLFGNRNEMIAPINEMADYFNISSSDMAQVVIVRAILKWPELPTGAKMTLEKFFNTFDRHAHRFG